MGSKEANLAKLLDEYGGTTSRELIGDIFSAVGENLEQARAVLADMAVEDDGKRESVEEKERESYMLGRYFGLPERCGAAALIACAGSESRASSLLLNLPGTEVGLMPENIEGEGEEDGWFDIAVFCAFQPASLGESSEVSDVMMRCCRRLLWCIANGTVSPSEYTRQVRRIASAEHDTLQPIGAVEMYLIDAMTGRNIGVADALADQLRREGVMIDREALEREEEEEELDGMERPEEDDDDDEMYLGGGGGGFERERMEDLFPELISKRKKSDWDSYGHPIGAKKGGKKGKKTPRMPEAILLTEEERGRREALLWIRLCYSAGMLQRLRIDVSAEDVEFVDAMRLLRAPDISIEDVCRSVHRRVPHASPPEVLDVVEQLGGERANEDEAVSVLRSLCAVDYLGGAVAEAGGVVSPGAARGQGIPPEDSGFGFIPPAPQAPPPKKKVPQSGGYWKVVGKKGNQEERDRQQAVQMAMEGRGDTVIVGRRVPRPGDEWLMEEGRRSGGAAVTFQSTEFEDLRLEIQAQIEHVRRGRARILERARSLGRGASSRDEVHALVERSRRLLAREHAIRDAGSRALVALRSGYGQGNIVVKTGSVVDLHGLTPQAGVAFVKSIIPMARRRHTDRFRIITGVGNHSRTPGVSPLRIQVRQLLQDLSESSRLRFTESVDGVFTVRP